VRTPSYERSQGLWPLWVILPIVSSSVAAQGLADQGLARVVSVVITIALPMVVLLMLGRLLIQIDAHRLEWRFGYLGWPHWSVDIAEIESVEVTRTTWADGWGIRRGREGWIYNAGWSDAVRIRTRDGRTIRLGSDEPERLVTVLSARLLPRR
jgi:hypothetical protein